MGDDKADSYLNFQSSTSLFEDLAMTLPSLRRNVDTDFANNMREKATEFALTRSMTRGGNSLLRVTALCPGFNRRSFIEKAARFGSTLEAPCAVADQAG
jgi:hypothetical protein